jgi:hypothetical protein
MSAVSASWKGKPAAAVKETYAYPHVG